jgi:tetratricopeptide (TPR) repeat protein
MPAAAPRDRAAGGGRMQERSMRRVSITVLAAIVIAMTSAACSKDPQKAKVEYFESGNRYFDQKKYQEAVVEYRNAIQQDPKYGEARYKLAETYAKLDDARNAYREYIRAADLLPANADAQLRAGTLLLLAGQYEDARTRADKVLATQPKHIEAQVLRANALAGLKNMEAAIEEINEAIALDPSKATTYANLGALEQVRGRAVEAEAAFKKAIEADPKSVIALLAYSNFLIAAGRGQEAEGSIKQALTIEPKNTLANRALAALYMSSNRRQEAEPVLKVLAENGDATSRLQLADYYLGMNRPDDAMPLLEAVSKENAHFAEAKARVAAIQFAQGKKPEANKTVDEVLAKQPNNAMLLLAKARLLLADRNVNEAVVKAKAAISADPTSIGAHYMLGSLQASRGEAEEAMASFREVLKLNPRAVAAQLQLSQLELSRGSSESSLQLAQDAVSNQPNNPLARLMLVRSLTARGELARAETEVKGLLTKYPNAAAVHAQAGMIALQRQDVAVARRSFEKALTIDQNSMEALTGLVMLDIGTRQPAEAIKRIDERLAKTPNVAGVHMLSARAHLANKDAAGAEAALRKAIELDSSLLQAYSLLGGIYLAQKKPDEAIAEFERIVAKQPKNISAHTMIGMILQAQGKGAEAQKRYEQVVTIDSRAAVAANNLAWIYAEADVNLDQALSLAQAAKAELPDQPEVNDTLGYVYLKKNLAALAVPPLRLSVEKDPKNPVYHYRLGVAYSKTGDKDGARKELQEALKLNATFPGADDAKQILASLQS